MASSVSNTLEFGMAPPALLSCASRLSLSSCNRLFLTSSSPAKYNKAVSLHHCIHTCNPILPISSASTLRSAFSRSRNNSSKNAKKSVQDEQLDADSDEDALEALFGQLEEDLKNDSLFMSDDDEDEISEADLARLEKELNDDFMDEDDDEESGALHLDKDNEGSHDDEDLDIPLKLKNWQRRRLAQALKVGRRKVSIKNLAGELGLDRAVVLNLLREPPPDLLLMSASLPDEIKVKETPLQIETEPLESVSTTVNVEETEESEPEKKEPVHVMRNRWSTRKRMKKVQVETLEKVYDGTKRPTNAMISSIVHVTNLPRKSVVKWFEDKRVEEGVPDRRVPFRRSESHY
ncbi:protein OVEREXPRESSOR OF CATIONIC PEROXIDASE 3 [Amborella trichopoda]|uniref:protein OVEREXPRESSOR OF CATIONIC PEROXIDASE 3 n=1 Tax=Amborella trichopoda TaxID=13333 RepID=UPI0005D38474|nr:protein OVEREXPRESSOR OF CATIONIC PEROXIDASE 3 [Amborella trichopoda]|eukprot:XP_011621948.1 protein OVEREXPRESSOR OF CATIONIC PEROXIDASE 3 [Amborella trichopoda]